MKRKTIYDYDRQLTIDEIEKPLIHSLDTSIRELRDETYENHRETTKRLTELEDGITESLKEILGMKVSIEVLNREMDTMKAEVKEIGREMGEVRGDIRAMESRLNAFETKMGWYLAVFGIVITVVLGVIQLLPK